MFEKEILRRNDYSGHWFRTPLFSFLLHLLQWKCHQKLSHGLNQFSRVELCQVFAIQRHTKVICIYWRLLCFSLSFFILLQMSFIGRNESKHFLVSRATCWSFHWYKYLIDNFFLAFRILALTTINKAFDWFIWTFFLSWAKLREKHSLDQLKSVSCQKTLSFVPKVLRVLISLVTWAVSLFLGNDFFFEQMLKSFMQCFQKQFVNEILWKLS